MQSFDHSGRELSESEARAELGLAPRPAQGSERVFEGDLSVYDYARGAGLRPPMPGVTIPDTLEGFEEQPPTPPAA